jgi:hypothetical protein
LRLKVYAYLLPTRSELGLDFNLRNDYQTCSITFMRSCRRICEELRCELYTVKRGHAIVYCAFKENVEITIFGKAIEMNKKDDA